MSGFRAFKWFFTTNTIECNRLIHDADSCFMCLQTKHFIFTSEKFFLSDSVCLGCETPGETFSAKKELLACDLNKNNIRFPPINEMIFLSVVRPKIIWSVLRKKISKISIKLCKLSSLRNNFELSLKSTNGKRKATSSSSCRRRKFSLFVEIKLSLLLENQNFIQEKKTFSRSIVIVGKQN